MAKAQDAGQARRMARAGSWFGTLDGAGAPHPADEDDDAAHSRLDRGEWRESDTADSRFLSRQARRIAGSGESGVQRLFRAFVAARVALALALFGTELIITWLATQPRNGLSLGLCAFYVVATLTLWWMPKLLGPPRPTVLRLRRRQLVATVGLDLVVFGALHALGGGGVLNYSALLVLPVLMAGVVMPRTQALGVAAAATLLVLVAALVGGGSLGENTPLLLTQAGFTGAGLFMVSVLAGEMSGRLAREERTARGSLEMARQQAQLNRLVIEEMQDGVLVVDRRGRVRAANPAARALLGEALVGSDGSFALADVAAWEPLLRAVDRAFVDGRWPEEGRDLLLAHGDGPRQVRLRVRFTQRREASIAEDICVLFIEDLRTVQARVRQEKLAAMGRVSAGIAHEIRNPLAAIMQANALMAEDAGDAQQRQLTRMVGENADRLKRIVDDMMEVAPGPASVPVPLDATAQVAAICSDWARTAQLPLGADSPLAVDLPAEALGAHFDADHLRRVLVNLLDNALRHGSRSAGAVRVRLFVSGEQHATLAVASDGEPISPDVERYLFEPFFSTRSRGTGLGLYICRELCERYGASLDYSARPPGDRHRNEFSVVLRRAPLPDGDSRLHL